MSFILEFDKNKFQSEEMVDYAKGTGIYFIKVDNVVLGTYPSGSKMMRIVGKANKYISWNSDEDIINNAVKLDNHQLETDKLYVGKNIDGEFEEGFGLNIFRSILGVTGKTKAKGSILKDGNKYFHNNKDVEVEEFKALQGIAIAVMIQEVFSLYTNKDNDEAVSTGMVIKRIYNSNSLKTTTEIIEKVEEAKAYLKDLSRYKPKYEDDLDEEIVADMRKQTKSKSKSKSSDDDVDDVDDDLPDDNDDTDLPDIDNSLDEDELTGLI